MSRFYVGQRVRILWSLKWPALGGQVGTVLGPADSDGNWGDGSVCDGTNVFVSPDCWGTCVSPEGHLFAPRTCNLEPATDSYDKTTWDTCIWKPEHLRVPA